MGVGGLATAVVSHFRRPELTARPRIVGVEPVNAACVMASARAGRLVSVPGPMDSIMAGLNCGVPSSVAWPIIATGIDVFAAIDDDYARKAMTALADAGVVSGETGAAGLAGLLWLLTGPDATENRRLLTIDRSSHVLVVATEGATDPSAYERIVGPRRKPGADQS
jgi:diaminopropionate ammonia-lyase